MPHLAYTSMMHVLAALLFFLAQPFWETKPPEQWTDREIDIMLGSSPWVQNIGPSPEVTVWFATAEPMEAAEAEARLHKRHPLREPDPDYLDFLRENREKVFVLAVGYPSLSGLSKEANAWTTLEKETVMTVSRKKYKIEGTFPPTPSDPVLRLVFPRVVKTEDKSVDFKLYLPGLSFPEREADFFVKALTYRGKLTM
jgi:hypothetical protein